jgi:hypothetical protein
LQGNEGLGGAADVGVLDKGHRSPALVVHAEATIARETWKTKRIKVNSTFIFGQIKC